MSSAPSMLNPFSPEVRQNPYPVYAELRRRGIYQLPESNMFLVSRYEDVREVMLNPEIFSVKEVGEAMMRHTPEILAVLAQGWPEVHTFTAEPEQHAQYHALLSETFSVQGVEKLRPRIQYIVNALIDTFIDDGRVEFVSKFVVPLVLRVLGEIVGIPEEEMPPGQTLVRRSPGAHGWGYQSSARAGIGAKPRSLPALSLVED